MVDKYVCQLRRGWKDDTIGRDDWTVYEMQPDHIKPLAGEIVIEYDNGIPRLKIGDGVREFSDLPYMSVDSFVLPTSAFVTIYPDKWEQTTDENGGVIENRYYQYVTINNATVTPNSKIDLQITPEDLVIFHEKDIAFTAINSCGQVRICVIGQKPTQQYTLKATVTEVVENA
jgi:hypothetical protein